MSLDVPMLFVYTKYACICDNPNFVLAQENFVRFAQLFFYCVFKI